MSALAAPAAASADSADAHATTAADTTRSHSHPARRGHHRGDLEAEKFDMWNTVDQYDEKHVIAQSKQMKTIDMVTGHDRRSRNRRVSIIKTGVVDAAAHHEEHGFALPENMKLTNEHVAAIVAQFVAGKKLNVHYAQNILKALHGLLSHTHNCVPFSVPKHGRCTVVGDTHGQFSDLHYILTRQGMPSKANMFLFNGDFVDRGGMGCEVFLTVAALKEICREHGLPLGGKKDALLERVRGFVDQPAAEPDDSGAMEPREEAAAAEWADADELADAGPEAEPEAEPEGEAEPDCPEPAGAEVSIIDDDF